MAFLSAFRRLPSVRPVVRVRYQSTVAAAVASPPTAADMQRLALIRNIGISAHIDSGKTTLTERILYYTGRIREIHEVRGKDGVGAKMDHMELEREKGITIQSAATFCRWGENRINIIDTPGHVDFTIEVERSLRVLDGAVLVLCGASGVQSQTSTVDRQMRRYNVPRISFINKLDRTGANPWKVIDQLRTKLRLNAAAINVPIGLEGNLEGVIDLINMKATYFDGSNGEKRRVAAIPSASLPEAEKRRAELIEKLVDVDDHLAELVLDEKPITEKDMKAAIRRATIALKFSPVMMGSAIKNKGVQLLLDGVADYLPNPSEKVNRALELDNNEAEITLSASADAPFVGLAFKLEEGRFGQLTYIRVYQGPSARQGTVRRGDQIFNAKTGKKVKVPRLVRLHANEMEDVEEIRSGEIGAMFGVDCSSGDTFTDGKVNYSMTSMYIPEPVISLAIAPKSKDANINFSKALNRFQREDPTFRVHTDIESSETIISGMGELHLEIYAERMKREYSCECVTGKPRVAFREAITQRAEFNYTHKKQSGGAGQYARVVGYLEPIETVKTEFVNQIIGNAIPPNFIPACEKGFVEAVTKGPLTQNPVTSLRMALTDGLAHSVDSNELSFRQATKSAFRQAFMDAKPILLEPIMEVEIVVPSEFQGTVIGELNRRKGVIMSSEEREGLCTVVAEVPLNNMFGYSTDLRSATQGKGEFSMEYTRHSPVSASDQERIVAEVKKRRTDDAASR